MARLNLEHLRTFLAVIRRGGVHRAAESLYLTQPAVTTRLKKLEAEIGNPLFDRSGGGVRLTKTGEMLREYAEKFEQLGALAESALISAEDFKTHLRIGVSETIAQCWLPDFISALHETYPRIKVDINVDISSNLRAALLNRELDLALLLGPISEYSVNNLELPPFELRWYSNPSKPMVDANQLNGQSVITYARNTRPYRELKASLFERFGHDIDIITSSSLTACFRLVEMGLGIAALPAALGERYVDEGKIIPIDLGWQPNPLVFTASYLGEPVDYNLQQVALLAQKSARAYARHPRTDL